MNDQDAAIPEPNSDPSAVGGERLLGAERLMRRYMDAKMTEAAETGGTVAEADVHAFHRMAGLSDDWGDIALTLAMQKARGQLYLALGIPADLDLTGTSISLNTDLLVKLIASGELHGMTLGVLAALNITDPADG